MDNNLEDTNESADESSSGKWTRRSFLTRVGQAGGAAALYETMVAMGMINTPPAWAGPPKLEKKSGIGKSVVILGAGIGGLTTAYLLSKYGYRCQILEASSRAGGRNHTARRGSTVIEQNEKNESTVQECAFDDGLYLNLGPGRLPYHHRRVLGYCNELNVELEPYIMNTTGNLYQSSKSDKKLGNKPVVYRKVQNDARGYIAELLAKAINQNKLDEELDGRDEEMLSLLQVFGPLGTRGPNGEPPETHEYKGSTRDGCGPDPDGQPTPNVYHNCGVQQKISLEDLLDSRFWEDSFYDPQEFEWQSTLFQPVGGMDKIVEGFLNKVGNLITYNAPVEAVEADENGVAITYLEGSASRVIKADYCVSNIPCPVLEKITNNFQEDPSFQLAIERTEFSSSCKVGWQCNERFWESNKNQIYGGISWTDHIIEQIWYPSNGFFGQKGALTGAYIHDQPGDGEKNATEFGKLSLSKRLELAKAGGALFHSEFGNDSIVPTDLGLSVAWQNVPYQEGAWPSWSDYNEDNADYRRILLPFKGRFYVVGDQASTLPGWQEGAMMSAEHVVELIGGSKEHVVPEGTRAPNTFKIMQGNG
ncbi:MAG: flavin monoamine oxidase family protein [Pirellulales bacterium]